MSQQRRARRRAARERKRQIPVRFGSHAEFVSALAAGAFRGEVVHAVILHDDDCDPLNCRCCPEIIVEPATAENLIAGAEAQERWIRSKAS